MEEKSLRTLNTSLDSLSSMLETHWIQSCNFKDKVMNEEARTIANIIILICHRISAGVC